MSNERTFTDRRLLAALDYIDQKYIDDVFNIIKEPESAADPQNISRRTPLKYWKQFVALAACLLLLSAAFPVLNYAVQRFGAGIWGGNAGAGTSELEVPTTAADEDIDSPYERSIYAYPEGMSAEEIYADVLKGGWIVQGFASQSPFDAGEDIWRTFLNCVDNKEPISVLYASFLDFESATLAEIYFDGDSFIVTRQERDHTSILETETKEFKFLLRGSGSYISSLFYFFSNYPDADIYDFWRNDIDARRDWDVFF